jgi:hypothetical protein
MPMLHIGAADEAVSRRYLMTLFLSCLLTKLGLLTKRDLLTKRGLLMLARDY